MVAGRPLRATRTAYRKKPPRGNVYPAITGTLASVLAGFGMAASGSAGTSLAQFSTSLSLTATSTGTFPYSATVLPLRGALPSGSYITSSDDASLRSSVLSTHDDGSAAVVVVAGTKAVTAGANTITLQGATGSQPGSNLTTAQIDALVSDVVVNFTLPYGGAATITDFSSSSPNFDRIWWANPQVICARYRLPAPTPGSTQLEAVIDIHAYAGGRAFVEIVVENCKLAAASGSPATPAAATYTGATVTVNGVLVATVSSTGPASAEGNHAAFRAWYAAAWIGGDPGLRATQLHTDLQLHPLLFKCDQAASFDMAGYASDAYTPWTTGRQRASGMGVGGDHASIGPIPQWEARALQSGDYRAWQATEVSALAALSFNVNYRDTGTGLVPTFAQIGSKWQGFGWPRTTNGNDAAMWEVAHHPAVGLMAFASRPSPVFIELAQKVAVWNGTWSASDTPGWTAGVHGYWYQVRGRAWCFRSQAHAAFLTPDGAAWKTSARTALANNVTYLDQWRTDGKYTLNMVCDASPASPDDHRVDRSGFQHSIWLHHYLITELHKVEQARVLTTGQPALTTFADWIALQPVRWVNEQTGGGWRYIPSKTTIGNGVANVIGSAATWLLERDRSGNTTGATSGVSGGWMTSASNNECPQAYSEYEANTTAGAYYPTYFWSALVAARERNVTGAEQAWSIVTQLITNLDTWRAGFASDPRWGSTPRLLGQGADVGSVAGTVWTPGRDSSGRINYKSLAAAPKNQWLTVADTTLNALESQITAAMPGWQDYGNETGLKAVLNNWNGFIEDKPNGRYWLHRAGGHNGGSCTGTFKFDALRMQWSIQKMPSDTNRWSAQYRNRTPPQGDTYTGCYESEQARLAEVAGGTWGPINKWWSDEIYWDNPTVPGGIVDEVGMPTSEHTYSGQVFDPVSNNLISCGRGQRLWKFSLTTSKYTYKRVLNDGDTANYSAAGATLVHDERTGIFQRSTATDGAYGVIRYNLRTDAWVVGGTVPWAIYTIADARYGRRVTGLTPVDQTGTNIGTYWVFDLDTGAVVPGQSGNVQFGGGLTRANFSNEFWYEAGDHGLVYVPPLNRYWYWQRNSAGAVKQYELDPTTTPWTLRYVTTPALENINKNLCRKAVWVEALNGVVLADEADENVNVYLF